MKSSTAADIMALISYPIVFGLFVWTMRFYVMVIPVLGFSYLFYGLFVWALMLGSLRAGYIFSTLIAIAGGLALNFPLELMCYFHANPECNRASSLNIDSIEMIKAVLPTVIAQQLLALSRLMNKRTQLADSSPDELPE